MSDNPDRHVEKVAEYAKLGRALADFQAGGPAEAAERALREFVGWARGERSPSRPPLATTDNLQQLLAELELCMFCRQQNGHEARCAFGRRRGQR